MSVVLVLSRFVLLRIRLLLSCTAPSNHGLDSYNQIEARTLSSQADESYYEESSQAVGE